jgi:ubiquinone/menaquinone biosynthesis C-methylase UbiE
MRSTSRTEVPVDEQAATGNAQEIASWNNDLGPRWTAMQSRLDALFAELTAAALDFAAPEPGEAVLDIGCGTGATLLELAPRVAPSGSVFGIDVSRVMLDLAQARVRAAGAANVTLTLADAASHHFADVAFDLAFSRFGVMFFADPVAAFANIRLGLRHGARLAFVTWQSFAENPFFHVAYHAAAPHLPPLPKTDPNAPGPFSLADPARVRHVLQAAGFSGIELVPLATSMRIGGTIGDAVEFAGKVGPAARALSGGDAAQRAAAEAAIGAAFAAYAGAGGIVLPGACWLVRADTA